MTEQNRTLDDVESAIAAEEAQDEQAPDYPREEIKTFDGFAGSGVTPRTIEGVEYANALDD